MIYHLCSTPLSLRITSLVFGCQLCYYFYYYYIYYLYKFILCAIFGKCKGCFSPTNFPIKPSVIYQSSVVLTCDRCCHKRSPHKRRIFICSYIPRSLFVPISSSSAWTLYLLSGAISVCTSRNRFFVFYSFALQFHTIMTLTVVPQHMDELQSLNQ